MKTEEQARSAIRALRYEILSSEVSNADTRVDQERPTAIRLKRALAFLDLAALALETDA
jgi:hypothetical protein